MTGLQDFLRWASNLPIFPKVLMTIVIVLVAALMVAILWVKPKPGIVEMNAIPADGKGSVWPADKSVDALKKTLDGISAENAKLVVAVASSGQYGIYVGELAKQLNISRAEAVLRSDQLQTQGLVIVLDLTDRNVRLNPDLQSILGPTFRDFLSAYLHVSPPK